MTDFYGERVGRWFGQVFRKGRPLPGMLSRPLVFLAQRSAERHHSGARKDLLRMDDKLGDLLAFAGRVE